MGLKIGELELKNRVMLGPMAGVTDLPFRLICKEHGVGLMVTEMVSSKALHYGDKKTKELTAIEEAERPVALQLFGSDPEIMAEAVELLNDHNCDAFDINMGCPAPKIVKNGDGSSLMKTPALAGIIVEAVVKVTKKPLMVKFRKGWDDQSVNAVEFAKIIEAAGADAITVHGRTRDQFYSGHADYDIIRQVKQAVKIPVIGNGDVFSIEDARRMIEVTGCDGIMIARGAQGNPWLLGEVAAYLETGLQMDKPSHEERIATAIKHLELIVQYKGEHIGVLEMRKHAAWYIKGMKHAAKIKQEINHAQSPDDIRHLLNELIVSK